ncbi:hypothetical protein Tco_0754308 [Tanacetum coccineum]
MTEMFLLYEALALIATFFVTLCGCKALHTAGMWFCSLFPGQGKRVERLFKKFTDDGLKYMAGAAIAMIGVGKGTEMSRLFGVPEPNPQAAPPLQTDRERLLESWAKQGAIYTTTTAIALLATDCSLGKRIEHTPTLIWIAVYNAGAFGHSKGQLLIGPYIYKVSNMTENEDVRSKFVRRALNVDDDEEELSWDVEDEAEDGNVVRENDKKPSLDCEREDDRKPSSDCKRENDNKPSLDHERENVSSDERRLSGGDVFGKKIESVLRTDEDHDNRLIMDEMKPSGGDKKVELVTKTNENVGVGSVSEKDKLQVDEDLEQDDIGDIRENDDKHVTQGGSLKKHEVSKRLNSGDDDEDLSWDTEDNDDDEPVKTGNSK